MFSVEKKKTVVTAAGSRIGAAIAQTLACAGTKAVVAGITIAIDVGLSAGK